MKNLILIIALIITFSKVALINLDPPKWDIAYYSPYDEHFYSEYAFNYFENPNEKFNNRKLFFGVPWITNIFTYISLSIFGDNYLGLRLSSILLSLITVFFMYKNLQQITQNNRVIFFVMLILVMSYPFTLSSIMVEPTIARIATLMISINLVFSLLKKGETNIPISLFITSLVISLLWILSYPTNFFVAVALMLSLIIPAILKKQRLIPILSSSLFGILLPVLIWLLLFLYYESNPLLIFKTVNDYSDRTSGGIKQTIINALQIGKANIFLFNPFLLTVFIFSLLTNILHVIKYKLYDGKNIIIPLFIVTFFLQTFIINDFPERKLIILLPLVLLSLTQTIVYMKEGYNTKISLGLLLISNVLSFLILFINIKIFNANLYSYQVAISIVANTILTLFVFYKKKYILLICYCLILITEIITTVDYSIIKSTQHYKNALTSLRKYDNSNFIGGWSQGFRVENNIKPFLNRYRYINQEDIFFKITDSISKNNILDYSIGSSSDSTRFRKIGFIIDSILIKSENTVDSIDYLIYKESPKK